MENGAVGASYDINLSWCDNGAPTGTFLTLSSGGTNLTFNNWVTGLKYNSVTGVATYEVSTGSGGYVARINAMCDAEGLPETAQCPAFISSVGIPKAEKVYIDLFTKDACPRHVPYCQLRNGIDFLSLVNTTVCPGVTEFYQGSPVGTFDFTFGWCQGPTFLSMALPNGGPVIRKFTEWITGLSYDNATSTTSYAVTDGNATASISVSCSASLPPGTVTCPKAFTVGPPGPNGEVVFDFTLQSKNACSRN